MLTAGSSVLAGEILVTNSGKILRDWCINRVTRNRVEIIHENGVTWFPHSAIPTEILQKYANQIRQKQESHLKQQGSIIKQSVAKALQAETTQAEIDRLVKIQEKYPNHPEIGEVEQLIAQKQKRLSVQKAITDSYEEETTEEQIAALQKILEEKVDDDLAVQIDQAIKERKKNLAKSVETIEKSIQIAAAQEDYKQSITALENILKKYPQYPVAAQQQTYQSKVNRLIAEKKEKLKNLQKKIAERINRYIQENPDTQNQLLTFFKHEAAVDRTKGEKILLATTNLASAMEKAQKQSNEEAAKTLNAALENSAEAIIKHEAIALKNKIETAIRQEAEYNAQMKKLQEIRVTNGYYGDFVIKKHINANNNWTLYLLPLSQRETVYKIWNLYRDHHKNRKLGDQYNRTSDDYHRQGYYLYQAAAEYKKMATDCLRESSSARDNANGLFRELNKLKPVSHRIDSNICSLSNLNVPVILVVSEDVIYGTSFLSGHVWYFEYIPGQSNNSWEITSDY